MTSRIPVWSVIPCAVLCEIVLFSVSENSIADANPAPGLEALLFVTVVFVLELTIIPLLVPVTVLLDITFAFALLIDIALLDVPVEFIVLLFILLLLVLWNRIPSEFSVSVVPLMMLQFRTVMLFFPVALTAFPVSRLL